jgi:CelD/BcsL family acetyltransferase involved in cellulose biosynthesis
MTLAPPSTGPTNAGPSPYAGCPKEWAIAIYGGPSLETLASPHDDGRPDLTFSDIVDLPVRFVADPFLVRHDERWLLFFEVLNASREKGEIAIASSTDAAAWRYDGVILSEPYHLSYPHVFSAGDEWLMTPETLDGGGVLLYRADDFPRRWSIDRVLLEGKWADPTVFEHGGGWWMFACATPFEHDRLELFWADDVRGPWHLHPRSPITSGDPRRSRPAGRPRVVGGTLMRFAQDCRPDYGSAVRAFAITKLTRAEYAEEELPSPVVTATGTGWNANGMHTVDLHPWRGGWIAAVDGYRYSPPPQYALVTTIEGFDTLAEEWNELLPRSTAHGVFGSHAWIRAALLARPDRAPHIATLRVDGRLAAILPFVRTADGMEFPTFLSDYNDFIASERLLAARAFNWILDTLPAGSRVVMRGLREGSDALAIARAYAPHVSIKPEVDCLFAELGASYYASRSKGLRKTIARARRAAAEAGAEVRVLPADADVAAIFLALNRDRFGEGSRFADAESIAFVREALPPLTRNGAIEAHALARGEDVLAIDLVLVTGDAFAPWNGGFRDEAAELGPGRLLFSAEIDRAMATGKRRFDLLRGPHPYKLPWSTGRDTLHLAEVITR